MNIKDIQVLKAYLTQGAPVAQSVECWTCNWEVAGLNQGLEDPCRTISIFSTPFSVPDFQKRHKTEDPSQPP